MAYMNQEIKSKIASAMKPILKKYGMKGTLSTDRNSISLNIKSGKLDMIRNFNETMSDPFRSGPRFDASSDQYIQVNPYWFQEHFSGKPRAFLKEAIQALNKGNWNNSNSQIDYFDVGWYSYVNIGKWNKPYTVEK
jgi:hypothetical protein